MRILAILMLACGSLVLACGSPVVPALSPDASPVSRPDPQPDPQPVEDPADHDHGDSLEGRAIHLAAIAFNTTEARLKVRVWPGTDRVPGSKTVRVTYKKGPTDRPSPSYRGIVIDTKLYMGEDEVTRAVLGLWTKGSKQWPEAADLAWLAEYGGSCSITSGPAEPPIDAICRGHAPQSARHNDGRRGVGYWVECRGGMMPSTSQSRWVAWIQPDKTIEKELDAVCTRGSARRR